jgi:ankyrin repeat protein
LEARNPQGFTALFYAALMNHLEAAQALIAAGADVNYPTKQGWLPLVVAREKKHAEMERMLKAGAREA